MSKLKLTFPFLPISVNQAFAGNGQRRYKSKEYLEFENKMEAFFRGIGEKRTIDGDNWLQFNYTLYMPLYFKNGKKKKQDLANYEKVLTDALVKYIEGFKDENIKILFSRKVDSEKLETEIEIIELI